MKLNKYIDHTLLKPEASEEQILNLIEEAKVYDFASICVNPTWTEFAAEQLKGSDVKVCVPIGFPLGANTSDVKGRTPSKRVRVKWIWSSMLAL